MSEYLNDPRERAIRPDKGITLEEDDRFETMYHWGAMVLDLCDFPIEEYMKPMTVICQGGSGGGGDSESGGTPTPTKRNVSIIIDVISPEGNVIGPDGSIIGTTDGDGTWKVRWEWDKDYSVVIASSVNLYDNNGQEYVVNALLMDNNNNKYEAIIQGIGDNSIERIGSFGIGTNPNEATNTDININDSTSNIVYSISIKPNSGQESIEYNIYYGAKSKSENLRNDELENILLKEANNEGGVAIEFLVPISDVYEAESELFDNGESPYDGDDAQDIWDSWSEQYENENRYTFRLYIPVEIEGNYTYNLFNDNAGQLTDANLVKTNNTRTINDIEYSEYVNEDINYAYDDKIRSFKLVFIITDK